jgi:hypothetical protein
MCPKSCRDFLRSAATSFATMVCVRGLPSRAELAFSGHSVLGWLTAGDRRHPEIALSRWQLPSGSALSAGASPIQVDRSQAFQDELGPGGALTHSSCFLFSQISATEHRQLLREFFSPDAQLLSVARTRTGASEYSRSTRTFCVNLPTNSVLKPQWP